MDTKVPAGIPDYFGDESGDQGSHDLENSVWEFYKSTFDLHKKRLIKKKMQKIKTRVGKDFDEKAVH